ncbi:MAG: MATE family efflux transporter [Treponema sp.]|jgi:putative MATE family efflux protein|nr:MATE family efflux transporter [Treponema sp.]
MKKGILGDRSFYRSLFVLAIPIALQNLVNSLVNVADTVMIGRLGTVEIAAVGLGNQFFFLYNMFLFGIVSGGSIFTAQFWGKQDLPGIRKSMGICLVLALGMGVIFTAAALFFPGKIISVYSRDPDVIRAGAVYLRRLFPSFIPYAISFVFSHAMRSTEKVRLPMITTVIALSMNMALNYLFIFGAGPIPAMGVAGAAIATVISRFVEAAILVMVSYAARYVIAGSPGQFLAFNGTYARNFFIIAGPVMLNEMLWSVGISVQNLIMARTNTDAIAAFNITATISQLTWVVFMGLGNGAAVLIGKKIGAGDEKTARDYAKKICVFDPLAALVIALLLIPLAMLIPVLFKVNAQVLSYTAAMFLILGFSYPFRSFNMTMIVGVCRAGGDTIFCTVYDLVVMWLISLPLAAAASFIFHAPVPVIYLCLSLEDPLKSLLGVWRLRSGKWLHNVIG